MGQLPETAPKYFGATARATWKKIVPFLNENSDVLEVDSNVVELFCTQYENFRNAYANVKKNGTILELKSIKQSSKGDQLGTEVSYKRNPATQIMNDASSQMLKIAGSFGLTPKARKEMLLNIDSGVEDEADLSAFMS
ncbi:phage terminase small subunit P27 family [Xylocopilactobacillus apis]|uniref:Phage terminase small subunit n=1 Tax=Xylocopilactobacillus apis TaxID=2932183 RepID=A0AAU9CSC4_9LACO|nr:phage terminase small subunit P27 family [Xylocopilactobacillus apis]BDR56887.1 phage terminase small subunit [Xylocopilactobacillus apis]